MPSVTPLMIFSLPSFTRLLRPLSIFCSFCDRNGRTKLLQILTEKSELGCSSTMVTIMRKVMQKNLLRKRRRKGVPTSAREKRIQQVRQRMSSYLSVLSRARKDRQAGMRQQTRLVRRECVLRMGASTSSSTNRMTKTMLGLTLYFFSTKASAGKRSRLSNLSWAKIFSTSCMTIYYKFRIAGTQNAVLPLTHPPATYSGGGLFCLMENCSFYEDNRMVMLEGGSIVGRVCCFGGVFQCQVIGIDQIGRKQQWQLGQLLRCFPFGVSRTVLLYSLQVISGILVLFRGDGAVREEVGRVNWGQVLLDGSVVLCCGVCWAFKLDIAQGIGAVTMDDFFTDIENQPQIGQDYQPPLYQQQGYDFQQPPAYQPDAQPAAFDFSGYASNQPSTAFQAELAPENDFNDFEEDEMTRRIREEEERIQTRLREKSEREWEDKRGRQEQGRRQLEEFNSRKEEERRARANENVRVEAERKEELAKLNVEAGWKKVITNINVRQGENKSKKDTNRMREAMLHRREDDSR